MALSGIDDNQAVILGAEIKINLLHNRRSRLQKIDGDETADRTGHLIQQSGGLVPVYVFGIFSNVGVGYGIHTAFIKECI